MPLTQSREITAATRLENVRYAIRDLACVAAEVGKQGHTILPLNIGDPINFDFATPAHLIDAVHKAMRDGKNGYAPSSGIPVALEAVRAEAARKGITNIQDVFISTGVSESVEICMTALLNPGEDLLTPCPDYPLYSAVLAKLDIGLNAYYLNEEDGWQPDLEDIKRKLTPRTRGIVLINPNNPTGSVCTRRMLEDIAELARQQNLVIFADEIYDKLILDDDEHISLAAVAPDVPCHHLWRTLQELSRARLAHRLDYRQRRRGRSRSLRRGHQQVAASPALCQSSRAVRHSSCPQRSAGSLARSSAEDAQPP